MESISSTGTWIGFSVFLLLALCIDTFVISKYRARSSANWRASLFWVSFWISSALLFNIGLWIYLKTVTDAVTANKVALDFLTAYLVEKSLSIDNLFVFYLVFQHFKIQTKYQGRVLTYGIWGAVIMRLGVILAGIWLISRFHWLLYVMGAFLVFTGIKIVFTKEKEKDLSETLVIKLMMKLFRVSHELNGDSFFVRKNGLLYITPMLIALVFIEISDLVFAVDSIPAVFAITREPLIVWSSNIFAILGLRVLYSLLARMVEELELLKYGIALILIFVGCKMLLEPWITIPSLLSLVIILGTIAIFSMFSYYQVASDRKQS